MTRQTIPCPHCGHTFLVEATHEGRRARCGHCDGAFVIEFGDAGSEAAAQLAELGAQVSEAEATLQHMREQIAQAAEELRTARQDECAALIAAEAARTQAEAARTQAEAARTEAEQAAVRRRENAACLSEHETRIEASRQRLAAFEGRVRLEELAARDTEARVEAARRMLVDIEQTHARERDELEVVQFQHRETEFGHAALTSQCEALRAEEAELRNSIVKLNTQSELMSGQRIAAEPRIASPDGKLLLPEDLELPAENGRPVDWIGGLRGVDLDGVRGREFLERLGPVLDHHPDRRTLDEWARQGRTVFVMCNTPDEAGRLKQLIDVWGEVDPDGVVAIASAFQSTSSLFAAPSRAVRTRRMPKNRRATRRRSVARRKR